MYQPKVDVIKLNWKKEKEDGKPGALAALSGAAVRCSVPCSEQSTLTLARLPSSLPQHNEWDCVCVLVSKCG